MTDKVVVLTTCASQEHASHLARHLIEERLAACVTILPQARSFYRWKEKIENEEEFVLLIKSGREVFPKLREAIAKEHTYEVPEVIALAVVDGSEAYLNWLDREIAQ